MIAIGCDHGGYELKLKVIEHLSERNIEYKDFGTYSADRADYPDYADKVCRAVVSGECEKGILICGTGIGVSIAANKVSGIRAALCNDVFCAKMAKQHNNANVLCMGGRVIGFEVAYFIVDTWLDEKFMGGRHQERIDKITALEE